MFKYPKTFQCDNGSDFKNEMTNLLENHSVEIQRATTKYKHTHTDFVEAFNNGLPNLLFQPMNAQELQNPENVSTIWVKNLNKTVKKMNNTISSMNGMKPKDAVKLQTGPLDKTYPKKPCYPKINCIDTFINLTNSMETKKDVQQTLPGAKIRID